MISEKEEVTDEKDPESNKALEKDVFTLGKVPLKLISARGTTIRTKEIASTSYVYG